MYNAFTLFPREENLSWLFLCFLGVSLIFFVDNPTIPIVGTF